MTEAGSPPPYIKSEPDDQNFSFLNYGSFNNQGQQYGSFQGSQSNIDGIDLSMNGTALTRPSFGSQQNLSSNFIAGSSALDDDDLTADFLDLDSNNNNNKQTGQTSQNQEHGYSSSQPQFSANQGFYSQMQQNSLQASQQGSFMNPTYSNTPPGNGPIVSPFVNTFNYSQWASIQNQQQHQQQQQQRRISQQRQASASSARNGSMPSRPSLLNGRASSDARSPITPRTSGMNNMQLGTPDSSHFDGQGIPVNQGSHGHRQSGSTQWGSGMSSGSAYLESPLESPRTGPTHPPISSVIDATKHASLPTKSEFPHSSGPPQNAEAKKRRRRESHNAVERRRRDNINDRIQELARLVPPYRLDDDRMRKSVNGSNPFSPTGMSPPQATSLLAGGTGRRAAGSITQGLPIDDKDKTPAKGDVLNGAVSWTRDLMWLLNRKLQQQSMLLETIERLNGQAPFETGENEHRMETEVLAAIERNGAANFEYSRPDGSGHFVPQHTDPSGARLSADDQRVFDGIDFQPSSGRANFTEDNFTWEYNPDNESARASLDFKEEDEFGMDMG